MEVPKHFGALFEEVLRDNRVDSNPSNLTIFPLERLPFRASSEPTGRYDIWYAVFYYTKITGAAY